MGVKFTVARAGFVTGVRFVRSPNEPPNTVHTGTLWDAATQTSLGMATFDTECSDPNPIWQGQPFPIPIAVQPGVTYVISVGVVFFSDTVGALQTAVTSNGAGDVTTVVGQNGVYEYKTTNDPAYPTQFPAEPGLFNYPNYWVDVEYQPAARHRVVTRQERGAQRRLQSNAVGLNFPYGLAFTSEGTLWVTDTNANLVRTFSCVETQAIITCPSCQNVTNVDVTSALTLPSTGITGTQVSIWFSASVNITSSFPPVEVCFVNQSLTIQPAGVTVPVPSGCINFDTTASTAAVQYDNAWRVTTPASPTCNVNTFLAGASYVVRVWRILHVAVRSLSTPT